MIGIGLGEWKGGGRREGKGEGRKRLESVNVTRGTSGQAASGHKGGGGVGKGKEWKRTNGWEENLRRGRQGADYCRVWNSLIWVSLESNLFVMFHWLPTLRLNDNVHQQANRVFKCRSVSVSFAWLFTP